MTEQGHYIASASKSDIELLVEVDVVEESVPIDGLVEKIILKFLIIST